MSYEYFLQAHLHQELQPISTESILAIFEPYITEKGQNHIDLQFDDNNSCTIYMDTEEPNNSGFMVSRPCEGKLGERLYKVMLLGNFAFFEPDGQNMIVANASVETHLPEDMIETFGAPTVAETLEDFLELYHNNR